MLVCGDASLMIWSGVLTHLQFGGMKGMAADLAHHCLQAHLVHAAHYKLPAGILFIDMKAAFYSVVRQGLFADGPDAAPFFAGNVLHGGCTSTCLDPLGHCPW